MTIDRSPAIVEPLIRQGLPQSGNCTRIPSNGYMCNDKNATCDNMNATYNEAVVGTFSGSDFNASPPVHIFNETEDLAAGVHIFDDETKDLVHKAAVDALEELSNPDEAVVLLHIGKILEQHLKWRTHLPTIQPYYAVKCNPDKKIIQVLNSMGAGFDVATEAEMNLVLSLGVDPKNIVYSHPCKPRSHLRHSAKKNVQLMSFDNESELKKIAEESPEANLLLRIVCEDKNAQCPMSMKFGAARRQWPGLIRTAKQRGLSIAGVSFHVGSGCKEPNSFEIALRDAKDVFALASEHGFNPSVLDIGGGFPGVDRDGDVRFEDIADTICRDLKQFFPKSEFPSLKVIAEPGRFFACSASTLLTKVFAKMKIQDPQDDATSTSFRYYLNDGLYGSFNCVLYDHATVQPELLAPRDGPLKKCCLFGPTCDGFDVIIKEHHIPELEEGDNIIWRDMGAYTTAAATHFNGFPTPHIWYYWTASEAKYVDMNNR
eukprot:gnl/MRDRNA2_/MRDRNA2_125584_c0_seq1.p1 gnl/MRDRNA2_/MRDRNA2_125584_c0~~gnl/MRDRNA2_/MRDRNA2_125584_c0_seq1.p1  ORF type:complete len:487 (-),score=103.15 gnl/MRDRNA2_/MRDRNA2_125584_c0_seq1:23-1483(-)